MTEQEIRKLSNHIFRLLKVDEISYPIGRTNKGDLSIKYDKYKDDFILVLDAVPLRENEIESKELKQLIRKYWFKIIPDETMVRRENKEANKEPTEVKKRGRPRKVK